MNRFLHVACIAASAAGLVAQQGDGGVAVAEAQLVAAQKWSMQGDPIRFTLRLAAVGGDARVRVAHSTGDFAWSECHVTGGGQAGGAPRPRHPGRSRGQGIVAAHMWWPPLPFESLWRNAYNACSACTALDAVHAVHAVHATRAVPLERACAAAAPWRRRVSVGRGLRVSAGTARRGLAARALQAGRGTGLLLLGRCQNGGLLSARLQGGRAEASAEDQGDVLDASGGRAGREPPRRRRPGHSSGPKDARVVPRMIPERRQIDAGMMGQ